MSVRWAAPLLQQPARLGLACWGTLGLCLLGGVAVAAWSSLSLPETAGRGVPPAAQSSDAEVKAQFDLSQRVISLVRDRGLDAQLPVAWSRFASAAGAPAETASGVSAPMAALEEVIVLRGPSGLVGVVNGEIVRRGDGLADGSRVVELDEERLIVRGRDGRRIEVLLRPAAASGRAASTRSEQ